MKRRIPKRKGSLVKEWRLVTVKAGGPGESRVKGTRSWRNGTSRRMEFRRASKKREEQVKKLYRNVGGEGNDVVQGLSLEWRRVDRPPPKSASSQDCRAR
jgi:hypothetical protein